MNASAPINLMALDTAGWSYAPAIASLLDFSTQKRVRKYPDYGDWGFRQTAVICYDGFSWVPVESRWASSENLLRDRMMEAIRSAVPWKSLPAFRKYDPYTARVLIVNGRRVAVLEFSTEIEITQGSDRLTVWENRQLVNAMPYIFYPPIRTMPFLRALKAPPTEES